MISALGASEAGVRFSFKSSTKRSSSPPSGFPFLILLSEIKCDSIYLFYCSLLRYCRERSERFLIVGKGSNCLFDDEGFDGCVILNRIDFLEKVEPGVYRVGSGYPFNRLGVQTASEGFTGLEFAGGVPGTVGGAAYMNAGANTQVKSSMRLRVFFRI